MPFENLDPKLNQHGVLAQRPFSSYQWLNDFTGTRKPRTCADVPTDPSDIRDNHLETSASVSGLD